MDMKEKIIFSCILIFGVLVISSGFIFDPSFVSTNLSPDGLLSKPTITKIYLIDTAFIILGVLVFFYSLMKVIASDYSRLIDDKIAKYAKKINDKITKVFVFFSFIKKDDPPRLRYCILFGITFLLILMVSGLITVIGQWQEADGWEYLWIAQNIERGHGFSYSSCNRWIAGIIDYPACKKQLQLTAYVEPGYPFFIAYMTKVFGKYGRLAILIFQVIALFLTSVVLYNIGRKVFNAATGIVAGLALSLMPQVRSLSLWEYTPAIFAGLLISFSVCLFYWCLEKISIRRGIALGAFLGFSSLIYSPILPFIPLMAFFVLISKRSFMSIQFKTALLIIVMAIIVISPWSIRNLLLFGHYIPIRSGFGSMIYESNPILAATFSSEADACSDKFGPIWKAQNAKEAVAALRIDGNKYSSLKYRALNCIEEIAPEGFKDYNEVEIDNFRQKKTFEFILSQPIIFSSLAYHRIQSFFIWGKRRTIISLLFVIGALMALRNQKSRIMILFVLAYASTYLLVPPLFFRYAYPIEPIMLVLASYFPALIVSRLFALNRSKS